MSGIDRASDYPTIIETMYPCQDKRCKEWLWASYGSCATCQRCYEHCVCHWPDNEADQEATEGETQ